MLAKWLKPAHAWLLALSLAIVAPSAAAGLPFEALALRAGSNAGTVPDSFDYQALAMRFGLPWQTRWGRWRVATHLDLGLGHIRADGRHAALVTIGPSATIRRGALLLDVGTAPSVLSRDHLNGREFGGWFQFTSHAGLYWQIDRRWRIGYRIQHTSNGGLYSVNDGVDLQMLDVWVAF